MSYHDVIKQRLHLLDFDKQTLASLKEIQSILEPSIDHILDRFYAQIVKDPELKAIFSSDESIAAARKAQREHWIDILFSGNLGKAHFDNAEKIGRTHEHIGLSLSTYLGGYCLMINQFLRVISDHFHNDNIGMTKKIHALNKAVFLDIDSVIDSYLDAKTHAMQKVLTNTEQFSNELKKINNILGKQAENHHAHLSKLRTHTDSNNERSFDLYQKITAIKNPETKAVNNSTVEINTLLQESTALLKENREISDSVYQAEQQAKLLAKQINKLNTHYDELQNGTNCHFFTTSGKKTLLQKVKSLFSSH